MGSLWRHRRNATRFWVQSNTVISVRDVIERTNETIGGAGPSGWDIDGLQLGDPDKSVAIVGVCHEVTEDVVGLARSHGIDLLVTYHPLLFRPVTSLVSGRGPSGRAFGLLDAGIALAVVHTRFDVATGGTADALAGAVGLGDVIGFGPSEAPPQIRVVTFVPADDADRVAQALAGAGAGLIGDYRNCSFRSSGTGTFEPGERTSPRIGEIGGFNTVDETRLEMIAPARSRDALIAALVSAHPYEEPAFDIYEVVSNTGFIGRIGSWSGDLAGLGAVAGEHCGQSGMRVSGDPNKKVSRVAVVPGSGSDFISAARSLGADAIVTGDVSHHRIVAALDSGVSVVDPGHAGTERPGMGAFHSVVLAATGDAASVVDLTDADPTPWR